MWMDEEYWDQEDVGRAHKEHSESEIESLRQQNHEKKLELEQQGFVVATLTSECSSLQTENHQLKLRETLHKEALRGLSSRLDRESEDEPRETPREQEPAEVTRLREDVGLLGVENKILADELAALKEKCSTGEADVKKARAKSRNLEDLVRESYLEVSTVKESLRCAKDECASLEDRLASCRSAYSHTLDVLSETKDALAQAQSDLHVARAPAKLERGNSIFSELEDSRTLLLTKYRELKVRHCDLAKKCASQARDVSKLKTDKISVLRLVEDMGTEEDGETAELVRALDARVSDLQRANKQLTSELQVPVRVVTEVDSAALKYLERVTAEAKQQVWALRRELEERSVALLMNQRLLNARQTELRVYWAENLRIKNELSEVRSSPGHLSKHPTPEERGHRQREVGAGDSKTVVASKELGQGDGLRSYTESLPVSEGNVAQDGLNHSKPKGVVQFQWDSIPEETPADDNDAKDGLDHSKSRGVVQFHVKTPPVETKTAGTDAKDGLYHSKPRGVVQFQGDFSPVDTPAFGNKAHDSLYHYKPRRVLPLHGKTQPVDTKNDGNDAKDGLYQATHIGTRKVYPKLVIHSKKS